MRTIAMAAFLGSSAVTGVATSAMLIWASTATLGLLTVGGFVVMAISAQGALRDRKSLDDQMEENRAETSAAHLRLSRGQPQRRPIGPVRLPSRNGHRTWPRTAREARR